LRIIPVIDVLNGVVVHAVRGRREQYQPIKSVLCETTNPLDMAFTFRSMGFRELYVADLDAILERRPVLSLWEQLAAKTGLIIMVDAGIMNVNDARELLATGISSIVIGTETLADPDFVKPILDLFGAERVRLSIDMRDGQVLARSERIQGLDQASVAAFFQDMGVSHFIALDLRRVGSLDGPDTRALQALTRTVQGEILVGGGIRDLRDLKELRSLGVHGALIATSLHSGAITMEQLRGSEFIV
jgi:phosphoribosylformimino-5-aminoimidazole carboxamide ribotide isomerase